MHFCGIGYAIWIPRHGYLSIIEDGLALLNPFAGAAARFRSPFAAWEASRRLKIDGAKVVDLNQRWWLG
jgi:hypothetical protein